MEKSSILLKRLCVKLCIKNDKVRKGGMKMNLETERLMLKLPQLEFAETCAAYYERNKEFLSEFEPMRDVEFYTAEHQRSLLGKEEHFVPAMSE